MDESESADLHRAFAAMADDPTAPPMPSVTDAAVAGGRRIRRRRAAAAAGSALAVAALAVSLAAGLPGLGSEDRSRPATPPPSSPPASSTPPSPSEPPSEIPSGIPTPTGNDDHPGVPSSGSSPSTDSE
ncbi:hypothetical protein [Streptomyces sp. NPDC004134]|uniref:hypothetical protein n=1 Tax=Streptomyces sp. NPDC004134 TaxID=3364691 RepID=UPI00368DB953